MNALTLLRNKKITPEQLFMLSVLLVNGGNYLYNLVLGRLLGPELFADAAVLITFLLVLSFIAMTYQLAAAKYVVLLEDNKLGGFIKVVFKNASLIGLALGGIVILCAGYLKDLFHTSSSGMFVLFGLGVPLYFVMSVNRGLYQGNKDYKHLSITYQAEMLSRLLITLGLIILFNIKSPLVIAFGILCSFAFGLLPFNLKQLKGSLTTGSDFKISSGMKRFFLITAFYELTQIIINNSDILLVKHYFEAYDAGLYASLALIGRIVYFVAWMFVMLLLPTVVNLKKEGHDTAPVLFKYVGYILVLALGIVLFCGLFPQFAITVLFGEDYLAMAPLLWKYALATGVFAISNIFAYYYLSLDHYKPVVISGLFGVLQMVLIIWFHQSLEQVVHMQILAMLILLVFQVSYFVLEMTSKRKLDKSKQFNHSSTGNGYPKKNNQNL